jgi:internalin A
MRDHPSPKSWRHRLRLSVRALMVLVLITGAGLGWVIHRARVQREAVAAIRKAGGQVAYNWEWKNGHWVLRGGKPLTPNAPRWLVHTLGIDFFGHVALVNISLPDDPDEVFTHIGQLEGLEDLLLSGSPPSDAALVHLNGLHRLRNLEINWTQHPNNARITDAGLSQIAKLINLEQLSLAYTQITDAGLAQLERLKRLEGLSLEGTQVTDAGLVHLKGLTRLTYIDLSRTRVSDEGLLQLSGLTNLKIGYVMKTGVTDAGVEKLRRALPNLHTFLR